MYGLKKGATVLCIKDGKDWYPENFKEHITKNFQVFDKEDICVDPVGKLGSHRSHAGVTVGGDFAKAGWFGFRKDGWVVLARPIDLEYDGVPLIEDN